MSPIAWLISLSRRHFLLLSAAFALLGLALAWHATVPVAHPVHWITVSVPPDDHDCPAPPARDCPIAPETPVVDELPFDRASLTGDMPYRGDLVRGVRWRDARGENTVLFSQIVSKKEVDGLQEESRYLFVRHYLTDELGETRMVVQIRQSDEGCTDDLATFFHRATQVTDLNRDGVGELTFGYFHGACITDMSAAEFKLFLIEDGEKHVLRGNGYFGSIDVPTAPRDDSGIAGSPKPFARHLRTLWPWLADQISSDRDL